MFKERTFRGRAITDFGEPCVDSLFRLFAFLSRSVRIARALGVIPQQLVGIEIRCITGKKMQREFAFGRFDAFRHPHGLVRRKTIKQPMQPHLTIGKYSYLRISSKSRQLQTMQISSRSK
jgi:hypothetical protein